MKNLSFLGRVSSSLFALIALSAILGATAAFAASDSDYEGFGQKVVDTLLDGNGKAFSKSINQDALMDTVFEGISPDDKTVKELRQGLSIGLDQIGDVLIRNLQGAQMKYLRARVKDDQNTALMRIDFGEKGINYLDFVIKEDDSGDLKIVDWYDYSKGQYYTDSIRQSIALLLPDEKTFFEKILGTGGLNKKEAKQFIKLGTLVNQQKYSEWLKTYEKLPAKLKDSRILLLTRILIAVMDGDDTTYRVALKDLYDQMGDDPTLSLILIDHYYFEEDFDTAQKALDSLAEHLGGDAAIDSLKANVYFTAEDYSQSVTYARKSIESDSEYEDAYWTLLNASVFAEDYGASVDALNMLADNFGYIFDPEEIENTDAYKDFVKSGAYKKWKEKQVAMEE